MGRDYRLEAFRVSSGARLWQDAQQRACYSFYFSESHVYVHCIDGLFAYERTTGTRTVVYAGHDMSELLHSDEVLAVQRDNGRVRLFDQATHKLLVEKTLKELAPQKHTTHLLPFPGGSGLCAIGEVFDRAVDTPSHNYMLGCYDAQLRSRWSRKPHFELVAGERHYHVRHIGPRYVVFDDQFGLDDDEAERPRIIGRGAIIDMLDGSQTNFDDNIFTTLQDPQGQLVVDADLLAIFRHDLSAKPIQSGFAHDEAWIERAETRTFVLMRRERYSALSAIDWTTRKVLFWTEVPLGPARTTLEIVDGKPLVRTVIADMWNATIHDPNTGAVLYHADRPWR
jgi:3',5'-cyclic AMP phosphodiesterase CpdA